MARESRKFAWMSQVPDSDRVVAAPRSERPSIGTERNCANKVRVAGENERRRGGMIEVPDADVLISVSGREAPTIRTESNRVHVPLHVAHVDWREARAIRTR